MVSLNSRTYRIKEICYDAGVQLVYLPLYSSDLNPIEELFAELKVCLKRSWYYYEENPQQGLNIFLE